MSEYFMTSIREIVWSILSGRKPNAYLHSGLQHWNLYHRKVEGTALCLGCGVSSVGKLINVHFKCMHYIVHKLWPNRVGWEGMGCAETYAQGRVWSELIVYNYEHFLSRVTKRVLNHFSDLLIMTWTNRCSQNVTLHLVYVRLQSTVNSIPAF